jgi:hypothetical protein
VARTAFQEFLSLSRLEPGLTVLVVDHLKRSAMFGGWDASRLMLLQSFRKVARHSKVELQILERLQDIHVEHVPKVGVEPTPGVKPDWILSPARLPVPPLRPLFGGLPVEFIPTKSRFLGTRSGPLRLSRCGKKIPRKTPNFKQDIHFAFGYFVGGAGELIRYDDRVSNA